MKKLIFYVFMFSMHIFNHAIAQKAFSVKSDYDTGELPYSVCSKDFNGDGKPDIAVANWNSHNVSVILNNTADGASAPSFADKTDFVTGSYPYSVASEDFNADGKSDLAVANYSGSVSVLLNNTSTGASVPVFASKTDFTAGAAPYSVCICDFNNDSKPDIAVANSSSNTVSILLNNTGNGAAIPVFRDKADFAVGSNPTSIYSGDLNGDSKPDLAIANNSSNTVSVLFNNTANGAVIPVFSSKTDFEAGNNPNSLFIGDLNDDSNPDMAVANLNSNTVSIFLNITAPGAPAPSFMVKTDFITGEGPTAVCIADFYGDGKPDIAVTNQYDNKVSVFLNATEAASTDLTFSQKMDFTTDAAPFSVCSNDFNGDTKPDIAVTNSNAQTASVLLNTIISGTTTLSFNNFTKDVGNFPNDACIGDLNADTKLDIAVVNYNDNTVSVFLNTTTPEASEPTFSVKTDFTTGSRPTSVSIGDLNGDGKPDLAVTNSSGNTVSIFLNTTENGAALPVFTEKTDFPTGVNPCSVGIGDFNGDGKRDLAVTNQSSATVSVLQNTTINGAVVPSFSDKVDFPTANSPRSVSVSDINGDSKRDIILANYNSSSISILLNTTPNPASLSFSDKTDFSTGTSPNSISISDLNQDNKPDIAVALPGSNKVSVFLNNTASGAAIPSFPNKTDFITGGFPIYVKLGELNGDNKPDMVSVNTLANTVSVFLNTTASGASEPAFTGKTDFPVSGINPVSVCIGNLNGDYMADLAVINQNSNNFSILVNNLFPLFPVELTSFTASIIDNYITLNWQTATEVNNYGFQVQRKKLNEMKSREAGDKVQSEEDKAEGEWEVVGFVEGSGNSNSPKDYSFVDTNPSSGILQYRLKQIDTDGSFEYYSTIAEINYSITGVNEKQIPKEFGLSQNYPNPFNPVTVIRYQIPVGTSRLVGSVFVQLKVYNILGREIVTLVNEEKQPGYYEINFNAGNLSSGIYIYRITAGSFTSTKKLMLIK